MRVVEKKFWKSKPMAAMSDAQWEALCDRCGKCCLHRYQVPDSGEIQFTTVCCRYLDCQNGACSDYSNRFRNQPECVRLSPAMLEEPDWLPESCAYRLLAEGKELPAWHPLISGDPQSVIDSGHFIGRVAVSELEADDPSHYLVDWIR